MSTVMTESTKDWNWVEHALLDYRQHNETVGIEGKTFAETKTALKAGFERMVKERERKLKDEIQDLHDDMAGEDL